MTILERMKDGLLGVVNRLLSEFSHSDAVAFSVFRGMTVKTYLKEGQMTGSLGAADLWVMQDEIPDSLDDACYAFYMPVNNLTGLDNCPSALHGNASGLSFADGHSEIHRWLYADIKNFK